MKSKTTLILVALGGLTLMLFFLVEQPRHARDAARTQSEERLTSARPEDVRSVTIVRPEVAIAGVRRNDRWELTSPVTDGGDDAAFNMLVITACNAVIERRFDAAGPELAEYGLATPSATVRFEAVDGGRLLELRIGDLNPLQSHCYALAGDGRDVLLLPSGLRRYALRSLFEFREKTIVDVEVADVARVEVTSRGRSMNWTAGEDGGWFARQGADTIRAKPSAVENVIRQIRGLRARDILWGEGPPGDAHLADPAGTIRLSGRGDPSEVTLTFSRPRGDGCYVVSSHKRRTALVDTTLIPLFAKDLEDFRDKRILSYEEDTVSKIAWDTPELTRTILRKDGGWAYANPAFGKIREDTARRLLSALASIEFAAVVQRPLAEPLGHGLDAPVLRVTLLDSGDRVVDEAVFGSRLPDGGSRYVWSRSTRALATISPEWASSLDDVLSALGGP